MPWVGRCEARDRRGGANAPSEGRESHVTAGVGGALGPGPQRARGAKWPRAPGRAGWREVGWAGWAARRNRGGRGSRRQSGRRHLVNIQWEVLGKRRCGCGGMENRAAAAGSRPSGLSGAPGPQPGSPTESRERRREQEMELRGV